MAQLVPNSLTTYKLTSEEELAGQILNDLQLICIQNKLAELIVARLTITLDTLNTLKFAQDEAYLKGQIDSLLWLVDTSKESLAEVNAINASHSQQ